MFSKLSEDLVLHCFLHLCECLLQIEKRYVVLEITEGKCNIAILIFKYKMNRNISPFAVRMNEKGLHSNTDIVIGARTCRKSIPPIITSSLLFVST